MNTAQYRLGSHRANPLKKDVPDTAYLVNISRNKIPDLCLDIYSSLWIPNNQREAAEALWQRFADTVYRKDDLELAIRTNYFLHNIEEFLKLNPNAVLINLGAGFSSYQYLVEGLSLTIEVDLNPIIIAKKKRASLLIKQKKISNRKTVYIVCDLSNKRQTAKAFSQIRQLTTGKPVFVLCEGLFYYLPANSSKKILDTFSRLNVPTLKIGFDYWKSELSEDVIYSRLLNFFSTEIKYSSKQITLVEPKEILDFSKYVVIDSTNVYQQEIVIFNTSNLKNESVSLNENYIMAELIT